MSKLNLKSPVGFWLGFASVCLWFGQGADLILMAARQPIHTTAEVLSQTPIENPFFYSISKGGKTSYILGTQHVGIQLRQFPAIVVQALQSSNVFVAEDIDQVSAKTDMSKIRKMEVRLLKPKTINAYQQRGINLQELQKQNVISLCVAYVYRDALELGYFLDKELEKMARKTQKQMMALDNENQISRAFSKIASECDPNVIVDALSPEAAKQGMLEALQNYIRGDEIHFLPRREWDNSIVLSDRNRTWLPKIKRAHRHGAFVAVGVSHLFGEKGLLEELKRDGYAILRLHNDSQSRFVSQRYTGL